jgi:hypothetical protein
MSFNEDDRPIDVIRLNTSAQAHVDAYLEYRAYVGGHPKAKQFI